MEFLQRYRWGITILLVLLAGVGGYCLWRKPSPDPSPPAAAIVVYTPTVPATETPRPSLPPAPIVVYVSGAVNNPGVYALPQGARVNDAIEAAGGPTSEADLVHINLARRVYDEEQIHIHKYGESTLSPQTPGPGAPTDDPASQGDPGAKININTATMAELDELPGIGPGYAQRIIDYRESYGPFTSIEEIQNVPGIGPATFARIRDLITVGT
jgi:competence protein ComEA